MSTPSLTVKAAAEMLGLPAYSQARILTEQKYPKSGSQAFKAPYYRTALSGIVSYYKKGGSASALDAARAKAQGLSQSARREHNLRVIKSFQKSDFATRALDIDKTSKIDATIGTVSIRLSPDIAALEQGESKIFYLNCRAQEMDQELARSALEVAHWVLESMGKKIPMQNLEYVDLFRNVNYNYKLRRARTIKRLQQNAKIIDTLWPTL